MTPEQAARELERMAKRVEVNVRDAETQSLRDLHATAQRMSGGGLRPRDLRRMGHPYAKRHGSPRLNPAMINAPSGEFRAAWAMLDPEWQGGALVSALHNTADHAEFLEQGTRFMFARPVDEAVAEEVAPRREARLEAAVERSLG